MRIYNQFQEALGEIKRDVVEMGIQIHPHTYQDKVVKDDPNFAAFELQNYIYTVTKPDVKDLNPTQPWADKEFLERISTEPLNPGDAWHHREDIWRQFLNDEGKFGYTYAERVASVKDNERALRDQIDYITNRLREDPDSRQLYMSIWDPQDLKNMGGVSRIPCSLGYYFQLRQGRLNMTYLQRSADLATHFENDIYLAFKMQKLISDIIDQPVGHYTHWVGSLHLFKKDSQGVF